MYVILGVLFPFIRYVCVCVYLYLYVCVYFLFQEILQQVDRPAARVGSTLGKVMGTAWAALGLATRTNDEVQQSITSTELMVQVCAASTTVQMVVLETELCGEQSCIWSIDRYVGMSRRCQRRRQNREGNMAPYTHFYSRSPDKKKRGRHTGRKSTLVAAFKSRGCFGTTHGCI